MVVVVSQVQVQVKKVVQVRRCFLMNSKAFDDDGSSFLLRDFYCLVEIEVSRGEMVEKEEGRLIEVEVEMEGVKHLRILHHRHHHRRHPKTMSLKHRRRWFELGKWEEEEEEGSAYEKKLEFLKRIEDEG